MWCSRLRNMTPDCATCLGEEGDVKGARDDAFRVPQMSEKYESRLRDIEEEMRQKDSAAAVIQVRAYQRCLLSFLQSEIRLRFRCHLKYTQKRRVYAERLAFSLR